MKKLFFSTLLFFTLDIGLANSAGNNRYVSGFQKVTFRSGPGKTNKIIKMIGTDEKVVVIDEADEWSLVRDSENVEGYILTRFLSTDIPGNLKYTWLKSKHDKLKEKFSTNSEKHKTLNTDHKEKLNLLQDKSKSYEELQIKYNELEKGAADYINLKKDYENSRDKLKTLILTNESLQEQLSKKYIVWFLAGAGVLLMGFLVGKTSKKSRYENSIQL